MHGSLQVAVKHHQQGNGRIVVVSMQNVGGWMFHFNLIVLSRATTGVEEHGGNGGDSMHTGDATSTGSATECIMANHNSTRSDCGRQT